MKKLKYVKTFESFKINEEGIFKNTIYGVSIALLSLLEPTKVMSNTDVAKVENFQNIKSDLQKLRDLAKSEEEKSLLNRIINLQESILKNKFDESELRIITNDLSSYLMKNKSDNTTFKDTLKNIQDRNINQLRIDYTNLYNMADDMTKTQTASLGDDFLVLIFLLAIISFLIAAIPVPDGKGGFQPFGVNIFTAFLNNRDRRDRDE